LPLSIALVPNYSDLNISMTLSQGAIVGIVIASIFGFIFLLALTALILLVRLKRSTDAD
jgi:predicted RND superfamily exporter protein